MEFYHPYCIDCRENVSWQEKGKECVNDSVVWEVTGKREEIKNLAKCWENCSIADVTEWETKIRDKLF